MSRTIREVAREIVVHWDKPNFAAKPYLDAMLQIDGDCSAQYYADSAQSIVLYFLANASSFRGEDAKRLKAELKKMAGVK